MRIKLLCSLLLCFGAVACQEDFLEKKPNKALVVPQTLQDFQALLDNITLFNTTPSMGIIASDEFQLVDNGLSKLSAAEQGVYLWKADPYQGDVVSDWIYPYQQIFYANVVLDGLKKLEKNSAMEDSWNKIRGAALFFRAYALFNLVQEFCVPYNKETVDTDMGIPLPLSSNVNNKLGRGKLGAVYSQIIIDLNEAGELLPRKGETKNRPSKQAVFALFARLYLVMEDYERALLNSSMALDMGNDLIDYNLLDSTVFNPFPDILPNGNVEVIFYAPRLSTSFFVPGAIKVDPSLLNLYKTGDIRKAIYFYDMGDGVVYNTNYEGLTVDELLLINAECKIRLKKIDEGLQELNKLLLKRYKEDFFEPLKAENEVDAVKLLIEERRKELVGRNLRWQDLRRFNRYKDFAKDVVRVYNGETYRLPANDSRYILPIPDAEILNNPNL